jgi:transcriptional regulator with XRE-family HTH domain
MTDKTPDSEQQNLGRALRELRERARITQKDMHAREGLDETYISRVEHGRIDVKWSTLARFLRVLGADLHQLADAIAKSKRQGPPKA